MAHLGPGWILKSLLKTVERQQAVPRGVAGYQAHGDRLEELSQINLELLRRGWGRLVHWPQTIRDDAFGYVRERYRIEDWRAVLVAVNRTLKTNQALASARINGLLVVSLDAAGQSQRVPECYHRQVYAQMQGPDFSVILDVAPIRPGEDEAAAALRLLGRMRRLYGLRFFAVAGVDAWYVTGPFLWEVQEPRFGEGGPVRVMLAEERWTQRRQQAGRYTRGERQSQWRRVATEELDGYGAEVIWAIGHRRWGVENHAFNELTQHYHLTHCPRHEPVTILAWLLILVLGFNLF